MTTQNDAALPPNSYWYKDAIIYELHIKAFRDGDGDGVGDFTGLLEKLDYLQELGITAIWLLPFYPSPLRDDGYDIADYYSINPAYGTIQQFSTLLEEAHRRGLRVITELVINHTSDQHPWFVRARSAPKGSPERDYYVWTDDPTQYRDVRIIFQDYETSNWTWDHEAQQYYWHRFFHHQPDLNFDNPLVQQEVFRMIDYWCELGVDGFRLDAIPYLFEREGTNGENLPETHAFLKKLRAHIDQHHPGVVFLAEANMWPEESASYFGAGDECHMNYHFPVMPRMFMALQMEDRYPITDIFDQTPAIPDSCQWAIFLRNHDELTLEMVTDEERDYMYKTYAKDPKARINLGIRHRLAPLMANNRKRIELLNSLLFSLPGTPVIYYGDEIGMGDNVYLGDRDGVRTPMQWSPDRNAGFSSANPQKLYLPTILDPEYHYESVNVETQRQNTSSLFWFMKRMISVRRKHPAFGRGDVQFLPVENPKVLAFTRSFQNETLLIVVNLSKYAQPAEIGLPGYKGYVPTELFSKNPFPVVGESESYFFTLAPHDYQWFQLEKVGADRADTALLPAFQLDDWDNLLTNGNRTVLETVVLPDYLLRADWMGERRHALRDVYVISQARVPLASGGAYVLLLEVTYERGLPDTFQLPLVLVDEAEAARLSNTCPQALLATLHTPGGTRMLGNGVYVPALQEALVQGFSRQHELGAATTRADNELLFQRRPTLADAEPFSAGLKPRLAHDCADYVAIRYGNHVQLKLYRKVDLIINPDAELTRFLTDTARFTHVPAHLATVSMRSAGGLVLLGVVEAMIGQQGNARQYMLERVSNLIERILARDRTQLDRILASPRGTLAEPVLFDALSAETQELLGRRAAELARELGVRVGAMHLALSSSQTPSDLAPEAFSLHYQRSLFAGLQSLVREAYQSIEQAVLPGPEQALADRLLSQRAPINESLRRIYHHKIDALKIRIHGDLQLEKVLLTGTDLAIRDFGGDPARSYSERRLKRSALRDVATLIRSFYQIADAGFAGSDQVSHSNAGELMAFAPIWAGYMSGFFVAAYLETVQHSALIPADLADRQQLLDTFLLEKGLLDLKQDLQQQPDRLRVAVQLIERVLEQPLRQPAV
ncbi:maltose alpha-D-glucosyltransferase [Spirosoma luteolum]